jgi:hypothetical protein
MKKYTYEFPLEILPHLSESGLDCIEILMVFMNIILNLVF